MIFDEPTQAARKLEERRRFIRLAAVGSAITALGAWWQFAPDAETKKARKLELPDGRPRLPPGQRVIKYLKPMGGLQGSPAKSNFRLKIHGAVREPLELDFEALLGLEQVERELDVHCVTGWSLLGTRWAGVRIAELAALAGVEDRAKHVIFEAAHGYTANVRLDEALANDAMVVYKHEGSYLAPPHGAPVRALVPSLYLWKSAKWLTGIRFDERDVAGYWEIRGYHNHADPWLEERYG